MDGVHAFLDSTFPTTTPNFQRAFDGILNEVGQQSLFQGPYYRVGLPFQKGSAGQNFFPRLETQFPPHLHQEQAWSRLRTEAKQSTLVATGTGSGKTECFLYPILDHILDNPSERGIKAIILYPMNALATDQARRFAEEINRNTATKDKVRVGLYVGGKSNESESMTAESVITNRDEMKRNPPDILMTNYKMLDYLLIRPDDLGLWSANTSESLSYLVVDELHTFDGAQGSDLACLIRRLKARLKTPKAHLCCVGTSATMGNDSGQGSMIQFAENIFGESFGEAQQAIITENRITPAAHIGLDRVESRWTEPPAPEDFDALMPSNYSTIEAYIAAQALLWFPAASALDFTASDDRFTLAEYLREHQFLRTLLTILGQKATTEESELLQALKERRPSWELEHRRLVCHSFLSLCAFARDRIGSTGAAPFLQIRSEVWMRELTRLVGSVSPKPEIKFSIDLPAEPLNKHLPVLHCRDCGVMGWGARQKTNSNELLPELDKFYEAWFAFYPDPRIRMVFPSTGSRGEALLQSYLCGNCLTNFESKDGTCINCGTKCDGSIDGESEGDAAVCTFPVDSFQKSKNKKDQLVADLSCPYCDSTAGLTIVGSRSASLSSVALSQIFGSPYNDDKKAMAFSDSVQDASHRAGFFSARTYPIAVRTALQEVIDQQEGPISLKALGHLYPKQWRTELGDKSFVGTFIPPNYEWDRDFELLIETNNLPLRSDLPKEVEDRLNWDTFREFGIQCRIGRTLEKSGSAASGLDLELLTTAATVFINSAREDGGYANLTQEWAEHFLLALSERLRRNGGIQHHRLDAYVKQKGNDYLFNQHKVLSPLGRPGSGRRPNFFATFTAKDSFERLISSSNSPTWTQLWVEKSLKLKDSSVLIESAVKSLVKHKIWTELEVDGDGKERAWGLNPEQLFIVNKSSHLVCDACSTSITVPVTHAAIWTTSPCMRHKCIGKHELAPNQDPNFFGDLYRRGDVVRVRAKEHTGMLDREDRESLERSFMREGTDSQSTDPKMLSCTPTLEMGVDVGNLSTVILCSVPPEQANYAQRVGRGGRRDGNSLALTVAASDPHDLAYYEVPQNMIAGDVRMPAIFLNAPAVLERQLTAFCIDRWVEETPSANIPDQMSTIYVHMSKSEESPGAFPSSLLKYIETNLAVLLDGFKSIFTAQELQAETLKHLEQFIKGDGDAEGSLAYKIQTLLTEAFRNRVDLFEMRKKTNRAIARNKKKTPRDEMLDNEAGELESERKGLSQIIKQMNEKNTLNFLTDEGVLPNYAFPEEGVVLHSVILKKPRADQKGKKLAKEEYEHMRPAEAAITELAPGSSFYVEGRKLTIDRVSVNQDNYEEWHFCRSCSYMEPVSTDSEARSQCPQCTCSGWKDTSLHQQMLKMRQVFVTAWDDKSRSGDQKDTRELTTFNKQTSITYKQEDVTKAYSLSSKGMGFAFEFLRDTHLREVNFGIDRFDGDPVEIGGKTMRGVGFRVCSECGKIWNNGRGNTKHMHDVSCKHFGTENEDNFDRSFLLYRSLNSEAIRLMIPSLSTDSDEDAQSFIAALHLGLRKKFGGHLSHLKLAIQYKPVPGMTLRTQHVYLYDAVPGGTGYLKELTRNADALLDVLEIALKELTSCSCKHDPERDGCYQCIKAYRFRFVDNQISRDIAIRQLTDILDKRSEIKERKNTDSLINPLLESELEKCFINALRSEKGFKLAPEIINSSPGYQLTIGDTVWQVELQRNLGAKDGVSRNCRPDVILTPIRPLTARPITIFLDGFAYHADEETGHNRIADDFAKRNAILQSKRFNVFSLTWDDLKGKNFPEGAFLEEGLSKVKNLLEGALADAKLWKTPNWNNWALLATYLRIQSKAAGDQVGWNKAACFTAMTGADRARVKNESLHELFEAIAAGKKPDIKLETTDDTMTLYQESGPFRLLTATPIDKIVDKSFDQSAAMLWFDDKQNQKTDEFRALWKQFLRASNLLQFVPRYATTTRNMLSSGVLGNSIDWVSEAQNASAEETSPTEPTSTLTGEQLEELSLLDPRLISVLAPLIKDASVPYPDFGYELLNESGSIEGSMTEVAWPKAKVIIALPDDDTAGFLASKWTILSAVGITADTILNTLNQSAE